MERKSFLITIAILLITLNSVAQVNGTFTDSRDGKVYKTVKISTQTWFAENLNFKTNKGSLCYNEEEFMCDRYGRLYSYDVAIYACPEGWRLPTAEDWLKLQNNLGFDEYFKDGVYLYSFYVGCSFSSKDNQWLNLKINEHPDCGKTGFNAKPGGYGWYDKSCHAVKENAYWWTATQVGIKNAYTVEYNGTDLKTNTNMNKVDYFISVRCIKN